MKFFWFLFIVTVAAVNMTIKGEDGGVLFISLKNLGIRLGLSESEMRNLAAAGKVRTVPYGRRRLVPIAEVERLAAELESGALTPSK